MWHLSVDSLLGLWLIVRIIEAGLKIGLFPFVIHESSVSWYGQQKMHDNPNCAWYFFHKTSHILKQTSMCDFWIIFHISPPVYMFFCPNLDYQEDSAWMKHVVICLVWSPCTGTRWYQNDRKEIKKMNSAFFKYGVISFFWVLCWRVLILSVRFQFSEKRNVAHGSKLWFLKIYYTRNEKEQATSQSHFYSSYI